MSGVRRLFSPRIADVLKSGNTYDLQVADADGQNPQVALRSREPVISPAWSPDGSKLAYVSFESGKPVVYVHTLATSARRSEEHTSELQSLMRISYAVFCLKKKTTPNRA